MGRPRLYKSNYDRLKAYRARQKQKIKVYHRSQTTEWETPQGLFDALHAEFGFTLDVCAQPNNAKCATFYTPEDDGLAQPWTGVCWMNPPYGREIRRWMNKAFLSAIYGATVVCLVPVRSDTKWWQALSPYAEIRFLPGRITFGGATHPAPFPNAVWIFRPNTTAPDGGQKHLGQ